MTHSELVFAAWRWLVSETACGVAFREYKSSRFSDEIPDVIGFDAVWISYVIECKATREDFLADAKKPFRINPGMGMGMQRYYCCPKDLIKKEELPRTWGLIYVDPETARAYIVHDPYDPALSVIHRFERNAAAEYLVMYSALKRMDIRGALEQLYEKVGGPMPHAQRVQSNAEVGDLWVRKGRPSQRLKIVEVNQHTIYAQSEKTGARDTIKKDKFYREFEKENQ